jgi:hypothetical protein
MGVDVALIPFGIRAMNRDVNPDTIPLGQLLRIVHGQGRLVFRGQFRRQGDLDLAGWDCIGLVVFQLGGIP